MLRTKTLRFDAVGFISNDTYSMTLCQIVVPNHQLTPIAQK